MANTNSFREAYLESARDFISPRYYRLHNGQIAEILSDALGQMSPMERDAFAVLSTQYAGENWLKSIGAAAAKLAPQIAPFVKMASPLVGSVIGGPVGGTIGSQLASLLKQPAPSTATSKAATTNAQPNTSTPELNQVAAQLMTLVGNPQFWQALLGQVLGATGNSNATPQQANKTESIPFGAMMTTLAELAQQAAEESVRTGTEESENYLLDSYGDYKVADPSNSEERSGLVMEMLREDYEWRNRTNEIQSWEESHNDPMTEWLMSAGLMRSR